ncbi:uncharacterized protein LOC134233320 isoform X2 [Saccostrea cucullata]|uniref:uncharacterized protein LOC134233320 isoform X2 n=1 Tax=Saccostrea cuccullata TaxID=36930 RepID=UPI002ED5A89D
MDGYTSENFSFICPYLLSGKKCRKECQCDYATCDPASGCLYTGPMQSTASNSTQSTGITMPYMNAPQKDDKVNQNLKILIGVIGSFAFIMLCVYVYVTVVSKDLRSTDPLITGNHTEGEDNSHNKNLYENVNIFENRSHSVGSTGNVEIILRPQ